MLPVNAIETGGESDAQTRLSSLSEIVKGIVVYFKARLDSTAPDLE